MPFESWASFYQSTGQNLWALLVAPVLFLAYRAGTGPPRPASTPHLDPDRRRLLDAYALVFAIETIVDPIATGPLARALGIAESFGGTALVFLFVWLGDFRVFALLFGLAAPEAARRAVARAALATCGVPIAAGAVYAALRAVQPELHGQWLWIVYECAFGSLALALRARWVPARVGPGRLRADLRAACAYVALYYALWAGSDLLIVIAELDLGWALRAVPNQLYYAFWIPFVWWRFTRPARPDPA